MQQQDCRHFLNSVARSVICLALFAPACDYAADDKIKGSHNTYQSHNSIGSKSNANHSGLRARRNTDTSGVHRNAGSNTYHYGLNHSQSRQDQRKKKPVTRNGDTDTKNNLYQKTDNPHGASRSDRNKPKRFNKTAGFRQEKKEVGKNTVNTITVVKSSNSTGAVSQSRYPVEKQYHTGKYGSNRESKHYNESHKVNTPDKLHNGKNEQKKYQLKTRHGHNEYFNKYKKHKKHIIKRHPVSRVFFVGYSFIPFSYFSYYNYYYPGLLAYSVPAYSYNENNYISGPAYNRESSGWVQLANGQVLAALDSFTREINSYPKAGIPKIGYALAIAADGDLTRAVLAMREALRHDPDSLQYIYLNEKLYGLVDNLIEQYEHLLLSLNRRPDEAFMVSVLYFLEMDYISAHNAIGRAISDGDRSLSTNNLHRIINAKLQENYAGDYN